MKPIKFRVSFDITFNIGNNEKTGWENICCNPFRIGESYFDIWRPNYPEEKETFNSWMGDLIGAGIRDYLYVSVGKIPYAKISSVETDKI